MQQQHQKQHYHQNSHAQLSQSKQFSNFPSNSQLKRSSYHNINQLKSLSPLKKSNPYYTNMNNKNQHIIIDEQNKNIENNNKICLDMQKIIKIKNNKIFKDYEVWKDNQITNKEFKNSKEMQQFEKSIEKYKEIVINNISTQIQLIYCQKPTILLTSLNQIYLILQGKAFEYVHNQNPIIKSKIHQNNDYVMVRKLAQNDYFITGIQKQIKNQSFYHRKQIHSSRGNKNDIKKDPMSKIDKYQKKYQLMVDEHTILVKISNQNYIKYFKPLIMQKINNLTKFMKNVSLFENLKNNVFLQLSRFIGVKCYKRGEQIIKVSEKIKSKEIFFVKQGEVRFSVYENKSQIQQSNKQLKLIEQLTLEEYDVFGMDTLHTVKKRTPLTLTDYQAIALSPQLQVYFIDKRILAIVISSFQSELKLSFANQNYIKQININSQIKGQNYMSQRQQYLLRNVNRIKTSQKKVRDDKLRRSYSKNMKRQINTVIPEKDRIEKNERNHQRFQSGSILARSQTSFKLKSVSLIKSSSFRQTARKNLVESLAWGVNETDGLQKHSFKNFALVEEKIAEKTKVNSFAITALEEDPQISTLVIKNKLSTFSNINLQKSVKKFQSLLKNSKFGLLNTKSNFVVTNSPQKRNPSFNQTLTNSFIPQMQKSGSFFDSISCRNKFQNPYKTQSQIIRNYIDKKLKNQILKKTQDVLDKKAQNQKISMKNLKKFYDSNSPTKKAKRQEELQLNQQQKVNKKSKQIISSQLFERMTNMKEYPLLCQIESQRKRMEASKRFQTKSITKKLKKQRNDKKQNKNFIMIKNGSPIQEDEKI